MYILQCNLGLFYFVSCDPRLDIKIDILPNSETKLKYPRWARRHFAYFAVCTLAIGGMKARSQSPADTRVHDHRQISFYLK